MAKLTAARETWLRTHSSSGEVNATASGSVDTGLMGEYDWEGIIGQIVGEGDEEEEVTIVTDLVSFYHLPSTVIGVSFF